MQFFFIIIIIYFIFRAFTGKTIFITGGSRGIGKAIALKCAQDGANVVIAAKTTMKHPKLDGTIYTAAEESMSLLFCFNYYNIINIVEKVGGKCLPVQCDIRDEKSVMKAVNNAVDRFGESIDVLINNASAISLTGKFISFLFSIKFLL